jgi:hypothetical protein
MSDSEWIELSASERACYRWPDDTDLHRQCRDAYVAGAAFYARRERIEELETALRELVIRCECKIRPFDFGIFVKRARVVLDKDAEK